VPGDEPHIVGWNPERLGEQSHGRVVRAATLRRGRHAELPGIAVPAYDSRALRARDNAQP